MKKDIKGPMHSFTIMFIIKEKPTGFLVVISTAGKLHIILEK
jgi:hypothetical protein